MIRNARLAGAALLVAAAGCSLLLRPAIDQCSRDSDCRSFGTGRTCVLGVCAPGPDSGALPTIDGSTKADAEADASDGKCTSNAACSQSNAGVPSICRGTDRTCVKLIDPTVCPFVWGGDTNNDDAIVVGAFLKIDPNNPLDQTSAVAVKLALDELKSAGNLPGPQGRSRPLAAVVCRNTEPITAAAAHLIDKVGVRAVLTHLGGETIVDFFRNRANAPSVQAFVLNPGYSNNTFPFQDASGRLWSIIGDVSDSAPAFQALLARVESYLKSGNDAGASEALRVTVLVSKTTNELALADTFAGVARFNGKNVSENAASVPPRFQQLQIDSVEVASAANYLTTIDSIISFRPHVIVALTREEFTTKILGPIEAGWPSVVDGGTQPRPFYILGQAS
jgi:hypothetical protein